MIQASTAEADDCKWSDSMPIHPFLPSPRYYDGL